jgi:hypothetical protein
VRYSDDTVERARTLHDAGYNYRQVGEAVGASLWTVRDWLTYRTR